MVLKNKLSITTMISRINVFEKNQGVLKALSSLQMYLGKSPIEKNLLHLLYFRVSQLNGCAFCLDMHSKDLRAAGESEQRLYMISAWDEAPVYTERERAAIAWAEAVTRLGREGVPDNVYERALRSFTEDELIDLTVAVIAINSYNRINVAFRTPSGHYQPGQFQAH
ncbi:alkylhydroperoxidase AhpD family core domain-containing protein [Siphonobacter aquaeclarae]|jgi:AhpD family alkylhydroperoxidase|uniref:Alkylhydroperoxidase AhpD family core domain-containing protein n=2 Tax=Siphonobacter aquaeclarae TaxID=563176 RepID=A0A1G9YBN8_9BACT|nr:alkylhydroperoxidase AhpD family core domain-containing protein [Siphonobacter aquaeclarae]